MSDPSKFTIGGVNGTTGRYLVEPGIDAKQVMAWALADAGAWFKDEKPDLHHGELLRRNERDEKGDYALAPELDPRNLTQTGWGVIFASDADPAIIEALQPLLQHRKKQAGANYFCFTGRDGHNPRQDKQSFLGYHSVASGMPADPAAGLPYYLLIVGNPERIPFRFQYELDVEYAVGRLSFDRLEDYDCYARSVVTAETDAAPPPRRVTMFSVRNPDDLATEYSSTLLVEPLRQVLAQKHADWATETIASAEASKERFARTLGADAPALWFSASHGMAFAATDARRARHQGALLTADWPGPKKWREPTIPESFYFAGDDIPADARLTGTMAFLYACYSAGTPAENDFPHEGLIKDELKDQLPSPLIANLPTRWLAHPKGGCLAVAGHVERAWACSFVGPRKNPQIGIFDAAIGQLLRGLPIGAAMEYFNQRYAGLATLLTGKLMKHALYDVPLQPESLWETASLWTEHNDARSYVILGDPATRLRPPAAAAEAPS